MIEPLPRDGTAIRELSEEEGRMPVLTDDETREIAGLGERIEEHYGSPQDTEWAYDDQRQRLHAPVAADHDDRGRARGRAGGAVGGRARGGPRPRPRRRARGRASGVVAKPATIDEASKLRDGDVLVTHMTAPDWVPLMRRAAAIVTDSGGMTCHAAIVSRELGIPCIVGTAEADEQAARRRARHRRRDRGRGPRGRGGGDRAAAAIPAAGTSAPAAPVTATRVLVNLSEPSQVDKAAALAVDGVGLLRAELMVLEALEGRHPRLLLERGEEGEFVDRMATGLATFANAFAPRPITYRTIDFRTNEFRGLEGGDRFEPEEANPMIGYRGALRYMHDPDVFPLELDAITRVWDAGHANFHVMLPFVRTARELEACR